MSRLGTRVSLLSLAMATVGMVATGGRVSMTLSGVKSGSVEMRHGGFCNSTASLGGTTIHIFAFSAENREWAVTIRS